MLKPWVSNWWAMSDKLGDWLQRRYWKQVNENQRIYRGFFFFFFFLRKPWMHLGRKTIDYLLAIQKAPSWMTCRSAHTAVILLPFPLPRPWFLEGSETIAMSRGCQSKERPCPPPPMQTCFKAWNKPELCVVGGWRGWPGLGRTEHIFRLEQELRTSMLLN